MEQASERMRVGQALIVLVCMALMALIGRLIYIQTEMRPMLQARAEKSQYAQIKLTGRRGAILDRRLRVLAGSKDQPTVFADPYLIDSPAVVASALGPILNKPVHELQTKLENPAAPRFVVLERYAEDIEVEAIRDLNLPGVGIQNHPGRTYPMGELAAQVIGFVGAEGQGLEGLELTWNRYLHPQSGRRVVFCDARRKALYSDPQSFVPPKDGLHVVLNIDAVIQEITERELAFRVDKHKAESGVAIVMNPQTGEVLAMANYPTYDLSDRGNAELDRRRNRILTDPVEPGSIFKPFVMATALDEKVTHPEEIIDCEGGMFQIGGRRLHDAHAYGALTTEMVLVKSSNIGMAKLGLRLGNEKMYEHLRRFGFGRQTGIDLPGEGEGLLMPLRAWNSYSTTSVPMGQELAVTPIQILTAFSSLVNGGHLLQPRVVRQVLDTEGQVVEDNTEVIDRGQVVDPSVAAQVKKMLIHVVSREGTGRNCIMEKWQAMGKTGTAQVPYTNRRGYEPGAYLASFVAAAPAEKPVLAALVMIRKPKGYPYYGGSVSAPVVKEIFEQSLEYLNIPPDKPGKEEARVVQNDSSSNHFAD